MPRIEPLDPTEATGKAKELLDATRKKIGKDINIFKTMAHAPAALEAYLKMGEALSRSSLSAAVREQLAVAIAGVSGCGYCASAHTAVGKGLGVDAAELGRNLDGEATDGKAQAAITLARKIINERGWIGDDDLQAARDGGLSQEEVIEIVAIVAQNLFTNYFNHIAGTEIDFPVVEVKPTADAH